MRRSPFPLICGAALIALAPQLARAHAIETELHVHAGDGSHRQAVSGQLQASAHGTPEAIELQSHFSNGQPVRDAAVRLVPAPGATPLELGRTDADGRLAFAMPRQVGAEAELQVDGGPGHRDWVELPPAGSTGLQASAPAPVMAPPLMAALPLAGLGMLGGLVVGLRRRGRP